MGMTIEQFNIIFKKIMAEHSWKAGMKGRAIKYIRPHFDGRSGLCFGVGIKCNVGGDECGEIDFFVTNEDRDKDLFTWINDWLDSTPKNDL